LLKHSFKAILIINKKVSFLPPQLTLNVWDLWTNDIQVINVLVADFWSIAKCTIMSQKILVSKSFFFFSLSNQFVSNVRIWKNIGDVKLKLLLFENSLTYYQQNVEILLHTIYLRLTWVGVKDSRFPFGP